MILTVKERIILGLIVPKEGNIVTLKLVQDVRSELSFDEGEIALLKLDTTDEGRMVWDPLMEPKCQKEISIGPALFKLIRAELDKLDSESKLPIDAISLWDKFEKADLVVIEKAPVMKKPLEEVENPPDEVTVLKLDERGNEITGIGEDGKPE